MKEQKTSKMVLKSILCIVVILLFYSIGGAISEINKMNPASTKLTQGICIWLSVLAVILFERIRKHSLSELGFRRVKVQGLKDTIYCIPVLLVIGVGALYGLNLQSTNYVLATLFMTVAVGFSEEIYFRALIFQFWKSAGTKKAILVSSFLFGTCHIANLLGHAGLLETLLQVVFAFVYGIVFALIFVLADSVIPCILLHFLHDFVVYIASEMTPTQEMVVASIQTGLLVLAMILLLCNYQRKMRRIQG